MSINAQQIESNLQNICNAFNNNIFTGEEYVIFMSAYAQHLTNKQFQPFEEKHDVANYNTLFSFFCNSKGLAVKDQQECQNIDTIKIILSNEWGSRLAARYAITNDEHRKSLILGGFIYQYFKHYRDLKTADAHKGALLNIFDNKTFESFEPMIPYLMSRVIDIFNNKPHTEPKTLKHL